ncbi:MAG TPA: DUF4190 domain-containing protein [Jiangellaceae bacterium]|nr:DUF4190 domain-containing protein [Jiangellaceae bacterium]
MSTNDPYQTNEHAPEQRVEYVPPPRLEFYPQLPQPQPAGTNGLAVAALVLGIVWAFWIGSALAIVFGHVALGQIKTKGQEGKGLAVAGLVLGYVGAGTFALFVVLPLLAAAGA